MQIETPGHERDAELAQLRAMVTELATRLAQLESDPRPAKHAKRMPDAARPPSSESAPTSRRGLLKRLGTSAAGAAVAATTLGATRPEQATADALATLAGPSTIEFGVYASPNGVARPALPSGRYGLVGIEDGAASVSPLNNYNTGVYGGGSNNPGVVGGSSFDHGIVGQTGPNLSFYSYPAAGVTGLSVGSIGTQGRSTNSHGVFGQTSAAAGTVFNGMLAAGLAGRTSSTIALYGYSDGPPNPNYAPVGGVGQCQSGFGVWGLSSAGPGTVSRPGGGSPIGVSGVLGTSDSTVGVYAISGGSYALAADANGPTTVGALIRGLGGGKAAVFVGNVEIQGHLTVTGGVNGPVSDAPAANSRGTTVAPPSLQVMQTREALVEDIGEGRLVGGQAEVRFDAALAALLADDQYHVVLTEYDDHSGLYVTGRTRQGFTVRAKDSSTASGTFSYRVIARPRTARTPADAAPLHVPTIPVPQGVPTLTVGREPPPPPPAPKPDRR
jgi:hypothetical protein